MMKIRREEGFKKKQRFREGLNSDNCLPSTSATIGTELAQLMSSSTSPNSILKPYLWLMRSGSVDGFLKNTGFNNKAAMESKALQQ
ncbi:hypothetical protein IGI04_040431 [Brassica rapa subsp. trilocularis]|uniref:Uncharacterized protein n=1 Tax=Brassica rapa subsp. trilocularis TaxID=1813537 RepID=A0ABQ7KQR4_BRACM|nr:hypothetical protein IGI04_040431 [Brassica rapa subsp. trilocularis]